MADSFKKSDYLTYFGGATTRRITADQWEAEGVEGQDTVEFRKGARSIKVSDLKADAVRLLLDRHPEEFRIDSDVPAAPNGE